MNDSIIFQEGDTFFYAGTLMDVTQVQVENHGLFAVTRGGCHAFWFDFTEVG